MTAKKSTSSAVEASVSSTREPMKALSRTPDQRELVPHQARFVRTTIQVMITVLAL
jgi:hypothetical protein